MPTPRRRIGTDGASEASPGGRLCVTRRAASQTGNSAPLRPRTPSDDVKVGELGESRNQEKDDTEHTDPEVLGFLTLE